MGAVYRRGQGFSTGMSKSVSLATVNALSSGSEIVTPGKSFHSHQAGIRAKPRDRRVEGPFTGVGRAKDPGHLPAEGERSVGKVTIFHAVVADPYQPGRKQKVGFNAHGDALANDLKYKRISVDQYAAGVSYRHMLEVSHGMPKTSSSEYLQPIGGNKVAGQTVRMCALLDQGENAAQFFRRTQAIIGQTGSRILELVLIGRGDGDGPLSFAKTAEALGMVEAIGRDRAQIETSARREGEKIGWAFRDALRLLATEWQFGLDKPEKLPIVPEPRKWGR
jgi:hypothetical protein